jgi:hypothetical protein
MFMSEEKWQEVSRLSRLALMIWLPPKSGIPKLGEEAAELAAATNQYACGKINEYTLATEMADTLFMIRQVQHLLPGWVLTQAIDDKLARLGHRVSEHIASCKTCGGTASEASPCVGCMPGAFVPRPKPSAAPLLRATEPTDETLNQIFRDFDVGMHVDDWRRRVYARCVREYLFLRQP